VITAISARNLNRVYRKDEAMASIRIYQRGGTRQEIMKFDNGIELLPDTARKLFNSLGEVVGWDNCLCVTGTLIDSYLFDNRESQVRIGGKVPRYIYMLETYKNPWNSVHTLVLSNSEKRAEMFRQEYEEQFNDEE
jgi:hypothetical protein